MGGNKSEGFPEGWGLHERGVLHESGTVIDQPDGIFGGVFIVRRQMTRHAG